MTPFGELILAAVAAKEALRSYEHGNSATDLAKEVADELEAKIPPALHERDVQFQEFIDITKALVKEIDELMEQLRKAALQPQPDASARP